MNILLTGAIGFIGSNLARRLSGEGHTVIGLDTYYDDGDLPVKARRLEWYKELPNAVYEGVDIRDEAGLDRVFDKYEVEAVINLAALAGVRQSSEEPVEFFESNVMGVINLLERCRKRGIKKFLQASSSSVYGPLEEVCDESARVDMPLSPYAASKSADELICYTYSHLYGMDIGMMRFFTTYGPWGRPNMLLFRLVKWINEGEPVTIFGDGRAERSYIYVDDLTAAINALFKKGKGYQVFNFAGSEHTTVNEMVKLVADYVGKEAKVVNLPANPADAFKSLGSIEKARRELGWSPEVDIASGVAKTVDWYVAQRDWALDAVPKSSG